MDHIFNNIFYGYNDNVDNNKIYCNITNEIIIEDGEPTDNFCYDLECDNYDEYEEEREDLFNA